MKKQNSGKREQFVRLEDGTQKPIADLRGDNANDEIYVKHLELRVRQLDAEEKLGVAQERIGNLIVNTKLELLRYFKETSEEGAPEGEDPILFRIDTFFKEKFTIPLLKDMDSETAKEISELFNPSKDADTEHQIENANPGDVVPQE